MISDEDKNKIIEDIKEGLKDYTIGKKYGHSPNSIKTIREKYKDVINVSVDDTEDKESSVVSDVKESKISKHTQRIKEKAKELVVEEDEIYGRAKEIIKDEKRQAIIDDYWKYSIQPKFDDYEWYTSETVSEMIGPFEDEIADLKGSIAQLNNQINQSNINHANEINQLKINHTAALELAKRKSYSDGLLQGTNNEKEIGDTIICYVCGEILSKSNLYIPCPHCHNAGHEIQNSISSGPPQQFFDFSF